MTNCYCYLTSPFFTSKSMVKIFAFHFRGFDGTTPRSAPGLCVCVCMSECMPVV